MRTRRNSGSILRLRGCRTGTNRSLVCQAGSNRSAARCGCGYRCGCRGRMSSQDIESVLARLTTLRDLAIFLLMLDGGLRPGEVLCLRLDDISYGRRRVTIRKRDDHPRGARAKSRQERVVDLHEPRTLDAVNRYASTYGWAFLFSQSLSPPSTHCCSAPCSTVPPGTPSPSHPRAHRSPLLLASVLGTLFGIFASTSAPALLLAIPIAVWEFSLGVYLIVRGSKPSPISAELTAAGKRPSAV